MISINWERYPRVAGHSSARDLLLLEASLPEELISNSTRKKWHEIVI
jgi:hypothetical protein